MAIIFLSNFFSVRIFAESESWFAAVKVFAIVAFIIPGFLAIIGVIPVHGYTHTPGLSNLYRNGLFPNSFGGVFTTMLTVILLFPGPIYDSLCGPLLPGALPLAAKSQEQ